MNTGKGWRTLVWSALVAIGPAALTWAAGVDWTQYVKPNIAMFIAGAVGFGLRYVTTTPVGKSE